MMTPQSGSCQGHRPADVGEPVWDLATFFPAQGSWSEADYLALETNRLVELTDGCIEVLPMPTLLHQLIVKLLLRRLDDHIGGSGLAACAPLPVRLRANLYREPDIIYLAPQRAAAGGEYPEGADLVMEVVSGSQQDRQRDYEQKRREYAEHGVAEYWIVDPLRAVVTVLTLAPNETEYAEHGVFGAGEQATSLALPGFAIAVDEILALQ